MAGIKVGIDARELQETINTGIGRYLSNFLILASEYKPEWEFVLFGNQYTSTGAIFRNYRTIIIREGSTLWWDQAKLPLALKKEKVSLFLSPYNKTSFLSPCKIAITIHDLIPFLAFLPREKEGFLKSYFKRVLSKLAAKRADLIITDSNNSKRDIIALLGIPENKIRVVYLGVAGSFYPRNNAASFAIIQKYKVVNDYILYVGNLKPHKNVIGLIKAYADLPQDLKDKHQLVIVGKKDKNFKGLLKLSRELKIEHKVIFVDFVKEDDLPFLYSKAALFVFPSFYEGFGLPVLEAMACGVAVLSSFAASLPEVAGDAARLFDPGDTVNMSRLMKELLYNPSLREELSRKGIERAKNFSLESAVKGIIDSIDSILR